MIEEQMTHRLCWYANKEVLYLEFNGQINSEELHAINQKVVEILDASQVRVHIVINANSLQTGYKTAKELRETQSYMHHPQLEYAYVIAGNKLNRLITLMAFSRSRAKFVQFDTLNKVEFLLERRGYERTLASFSI